MFSIKVMAGEREQNMLQKNSCYLILYDIQLAIRSIAFWFSSTVLKINSLMIEELAVLQ